jgi:hypothetical protein
MQESAGSSGCRFQDHQFDRDLDPEWLRARRLQQRIGGRAARELRDLWEEEILSRLGLYGEPTEVLPHIEPDRAPVIRKLKLAAVHGCYAVEIHVRVWTGTWQTVLTGTLSHQQASPFLRLGKLPAKSYGKVLPTVIRHRIYTNACLAGRPELRCLLSGRLPALRLA